MEGRTEGEAEPEGSQSISEPILIPRANIAPDTATFMGPKQREEAKESMLEVRTVDMTWKRDPGGEGRVMCG